MISKVEYDATAAQSWRIGADGMGARDIDDAVARRDRPTNANIILGEMPGLGDGSKIELIVHDKFRDGGKFISEGTNVISCDFEKLFTFRTLGK